MKTEVIMKRELFGMPISQKSKSEFFSATDLAKAGTKWRSANGLPAFNLSQFLAQQKTKEFIAEIESAHGISPLSKGRGRNSATWVHPLLFIDIALAISPKLKIEAYQWLFDNLIRFRNESGESYVKMCGALYKRATDKARFHQNIPKAANQIKIACGVKEWNSATPEQLKKRDRMHENIYRMCSVLNDANEAIRIAFLLEDDRAIKDKN